MANKSSPVGNWRRLELVDTEGVCAERELVNLSSPTVEIKNTWGGGLLSLSIRLYVLMSMHKPNYEISVKHKVCEYCILQFNVCGTNEVKPLGSGCNINFLHPTLLPLFVPYVAVQIKMVTRLILTEFILLVPVAWQ
jgi:hypothetical protein